MKVGLIVAISVIALVVIGIVLGSIAFVTVLKRPANTANSYLRAISEGNISTAFEYLAAQTQEEETCSGLESKLEPFKGSIKKYNTSSVNVQSGGKAQVVMEIRFTNNSTATWDMYLTKEDAKWKIRTVTPR